MSWFIDLVEDESNINDQNDVTNDNSMFDEHRRDTVCICLSVSFFSKLSERIPILRFYNNKLTFYTAHTSIINSAAPFGISFEDYFATERLLWYQPDAPLTETCLGVLIFSILL